MITANRYKGRFLFLNKFYPLFLLIFLIFCISILGQYSAFNGKFFGPVQNHILRIIAGTFVMIFVFISDFKIWRTFAYVFYAISMLALIAVYLLGTVKLGAQRWIDFHYFTFQPSELIKIALVLSLSKYYSMLSFSEIKNIKNHIIPIFLTILPTIFIIKQPDLGTAMLLFCVGIGIIFISGFPLRFFIGSVATGLALCPLGWFFLHDYQKNRILTFLNPDKEPSGLGYHVLQSKIAIGSGRIFGKGFLQGTQSKLSFLPEKNTDFIFTTLAEEIGFFGSVFVILLFAGLILYFFWAAYNSKTIFSRLMCSGLGLMLLLHVFVNIAMVMGIVPIVGIPLPFLSYGGCSMITFMISCGLMMASMDGTRNKLSSYIVS